jgi:hypothetical protein
MNIDLGKVVGTATATVALIIASSIFLQNLSTKYLALMGRLGQLTEEVRKSRPGGVRGASLRELIGTTEQQCQLVRVGSMYLEWAVLTFVITVVSASLSTAFPAVGAAKLIGGCSLVVGLVLLSISVVYEMRENWLSKALFRSEIADLDTTRTDVQ